MTANYDTQLLALVAAASINADGSTPITYGCAVTRTGAGTYLLVLPTGDGIVDVQSFTRITAKAGGGTPVVIVASDVDADGYLKAISCFNNAGGALADNALEIVVQRAATNPLDTTTPP